MKEKTIEDLNLYKEEIICLYLKNGKNVNQISEQLNLYSGSTISRYLKLIGIRRTKEEQLEDLHYILRDKERIISDSTRKKLSKSVKNSWKKEEVRKNHIKAQVKMWKRKSYEYKINRTKKGLIAMHKKLLALSSSSIEIKIENVLKDLNIEYVKQKRLVTAKRAFYLDFWIPKYELVIECNGEYWHRLPDKIIRDKILENSCIKHNKNILWLWENEINNDIDSCKNKIVDKILHILLKNN